jgi:hypothetical protein
MGFRYRSIIAGVALGSLSAFLSNHLAALFHADPAFFMRVMKAIGVALVVPGVIAAIIAGNAHDFALWLAATVNFLFWLGFALLVGLFIARLRQLRRAISAVTISRDKPSSLGSE